MICAIGLVRPAYEKNKCDLTSRELEVMRLVADGLKNKDIRLALGISSNTVAIHLPSVNRKLCVNNRARAVLRCLNGVGSNLKWGNRCCCSNVKGQFDDNLGERNGVWGSVHRLRPNPHYRYL